MKTYADLYTESPRAFLRKLEDDIKSLEKRIQKIDQLATSGLGSLLEEYERLSLVVEQKAYGITLSSSWSWNAGDDGASVPNLYKPELASDEVSYCWTGPEPVTVFEANLQRDINLEVEVRILGAVNDSVFAATYLKIDGHGVKCEIANGVLRAVIEKRMKQSLKSTEIQLETGETYAPTNEDGRKLGLALLSIQVTPQN